MNYHDDIRINFDNQPDVVKMPRRDFFKLPPTMRRFEPRVGLQVMATTRQGENFVSVVLIG